MGNKVKPWHNPEKRPRGFEAQEERGKSGKGYRSKQDRQDHQNKRVDLRKFTPDF
jgi:hypothetical protein